MKRALFSAVLVTVAGLSVSVASAGPIPPPPHLNNRYVCVVTDDNPEAPRAVCVWAPLPVIAGR